MARRLSKMRKSAILEHLLELERQIREELSRPGRDRPDRSGKASPNDMALEGSPGSTRPEVTQRYLH